MPAATGSDKLRNQAIRRPAKASPPLTVLQRDEHVAEWIRLTEEAEHVLRQPDAKPKAGPKGGRPQSGVRSAARELNLDEADARRAIKVASLSDEAKEVAREVGLDDNRSAFSWANAGLSFFN
jgi:hypothetical protein